MVRINTIVITSVLLLGVTLGCGPTQEESLVQGLYLGHTPPGRTAELFAPELAGDNESLGCSGFLRDGTVFVFSSMKRGGDWRFRPVWVTELKDGRWTNPEVAPFSSYMPYNFTVGPAGKTLYFTTLKSPDRGSSMLLEQANIWAVTLAPNGWTEPVMLCASINTETDYENYPTVARNGNIYYMSWRDDTVGRTDIYRSRNRDGKYHPAENLGPPINSVESDQDPWVAPDESYLIVCLKGREDSFGSYDLYVSFSNEDGSWAEPVNLGENVNTSGAEFRPYVTQDEKYLFFTAPDSEIGNVGRIFWVSAEIIEELRELHQR
ncbi:MAG: hypothetical protein GY906_01265 [bacterium]|nr:hypothetical protein [bacterium]